MTKPKVIQIHNVPPGLRPVDGYEGRYSVSSDGRVWSHAKTTGTSRHGGRWMKPWIGAGYQQVTLTSELGQVKHYVHRLVARAWVHNPAPDSYAEVNHLDGDKLNCKASNLEWCDRSRNLRHAYEIGLQPDRKAPRYSDRMRLLGISSRRFTPDEVADIRRRHSRGETAYSLAKELGFSETAMYRIVSHQTYRD